MERNVPTPPEVESVWQETALPAAAFPRLTSEVSATVAILGGGYTGLSAAHHLAEAGIDAVVLEAAAPGWGASGRNGGMLVPRPKTSLIEIETLWGRDEALRQRRLQREAVETVARLVEDHGVACHFAQEGYLAAAHTETARDALAAEAAWLRGVGGEATARALGKDGMAEALGGGAYRGGYLDPLGARIQPLSYARGLAAGMARRGVPIYAESAALSLEAEAAGWRVRTAAGAVRAQHVVLATNGYTPPGLFPGAMHRRVVPVSASAVATAPLPGNLAGRILPGGRTLSDTKRLLNWMRLTPDNRLVFGGRADITGKRSDAASYRGIETALHALFPDLRDVPITHRWSGFVAVTQDHWPHLGSLAPRLHYALGYGGRGVAMASLLGKYLAQQVAGPAPELGPITASPFRPIPLHGLRVPAMRSLAAWYRLKDRLGV
jgi:glycine/D-amino acid oxidase-like deaminating enzyme